MQIKSSCQLPDFSVVNVNVSGHQTLRLACLTQDVNTPLYTGWEETVNKYFRVSKETQRIDFVRTEKTKRQQTLVN